MYRKNGAGRRLAALAAALVMLFAALAEVQDVSAADTRKAAAGKTNAKKKESWTIEKKNVFYYKGGKKLTGLRKLNGKYYFFDKKGVQRTGWQKIRGNYYFFRIKNGIKGYMVTSKKVNGVTLKSNGKAKKTKASTAKLKVLIKANRIMEKATKPTMKKSEKLRACYNFSMKRFKYRGSPKFQKTKNWEYQYALDMFDRGHGSCYAYGAAFAFLANAVGYTDVYAISSGGHGWAEVKGKVFDPSWDIVDKKHHYYKISYSLSGKGGRPNYKRNKTYVKKI